MVWGFTPLPYSWKGAFTLPLSVGPGGEARGGLSVPVRWLEMRCSRCDRLLQKMEEHALRPGKRIEIKCSHCKVINYSVGG
jgi:hypothetical protein